MTATGFIVGGIDPALADELRARGGITYVADDNGYPCRQCLRDAEVGDELILVSYDPVCGLIAVSIGQPDLSAPVTMQPR